MPQSSTTIFCLFPVKTCHLLGNAEIKFLFLFRGPHNINTPIQVFLPLIVASILNIQGLTLKRGSKKPPCVRKTPKAMATPNIIPTMAINPIATTKDRTSNLPPYIHRRFQITLPMPLPISVWLLH
jgi:hypothetical protein